MTVCGGCGKTLGFKKYKFHRMWKIPGYYCKECMLELGRDFDKNAKITLPKKACALCELEFYYLKSAWHNKAQKGYCDVCYQAISSGTIPDKAMREMPKKLPHVVMIFAGLGVLMMALGLAFTLSTAGQNASLVNILFGATTTALGFVIFRKAVKSRALIAAKSRGPES